MTSWHLHSLKTVAPPAKQCMLGQHKEATQELSKDRDRELKVSESTKKVPDPNVIEYPKGTLYSRTLKVSISITHRVLDTTGPQDHR